MNAPTLDTLAEVRRALDAIVPTAHDLSGYADCACRTEGAREWLADVRGSMVEDLAYLIADSGEVPGSEVTDLLAEVADRMVPVYTAERFDLLASTGAYAEDIVGELGVVDGDLEQQAAAALYLVAARLCSTLWDEVDDDALLDILDLLPTEWDEDDFEPEAIEPEPLDPFE